MSGRSYYIAREVPPPHAHLQLELRASASASDWFVHLIVVLKLTYETPSKLGVRILSTSRRVLTTQSLFHDRNAERPMVLSLDLQSPHRPRQPHDDHPLQKCRREKRVFDTNWTRQLLERRAIRKRFRPRLPRYSLKRAAPTLGGAITRKVTSGKLLDRHAHIQVTSERRMVPTTLWTQHVLCDSEGRYVGPLTRKLMLQARCRGGI